MDLEAEVDRLRADMTSLQHHTQNEPLPGMEFAILFATMRWPCYSLLRNLGWLVPTWGLSKERKDLTSNPVGNHDPNSRIGMNGSVRRT